MSTIGTGTAKNTIALPAIPVLCVVGGHLHHLSADGEIETLPLKDHHNFPHDQSVLVCHAPYIRQKANLQDDLDYIDALELFAFIHPAQFCVPTVQGLCAALGLPAPEQAEDLPLSLMDCVSSLLSDIAEKPGEERETMVRLAAVMGMQGKGWRWTPFIFSALGETYDPALLHQDRKAFDVWSALPEWSEQAPPVPESHYPVTAKESRERLAQIRGVGAEERPAQAQYSENGALAFAPPREDQQPHIVLAEAGTGIGKTLAYLAPASVWAEKNDGAVWISTYTKNLQRQLDKELDKLYPQTELKAAKTAIRKGRENYLCLLNFEDTSAAAALAHHRQKVVAAGLMARWIMTSKDGDLSGGDFPGWLTGLLGYADSLGLADRRGECIHSACDHYHRCFVERSIRKSRHANLVIANHALVMINTALATTDDDLPSRYIFDEAHHIFDAADSAFSIHLTARETSDFRRWILGMEGGKRSRARGLKRRIEDLIADTPEAQNELEKLVQSAYALPAFGWSRRFKDNIPDGPTEKFLKAIYDQVFARADGRNGPYSLETPSFPLSDSLSAPLKKLRTELSKMQRPMVQLAKLLLEKLRNDEGDLHEDTRKRIDAVARSLERRGKITLQGWIDLLGSLADNKAIDGRIDWMEIERIDGKAIDVGLHQHLIDPASAFAAAMKPHAHGAIFTSATLRDKNQEEHDSWAQAAKMTGTDKLSTNPHSFYLPSPFDYAAQTKIFVITDVRKDDLKQVARAYQSLFRACGGGAIGLFTAIQRLKAVYEHIAPDLETHNIPVYAQHMDHIDTGTLVDMFRSDHNSCLLGTDAVRDGVDVPGDSLRLIAFDRVPWPRPTILHKERRKHMGGKDYDERLTRMKLKQAFGRLVRHSSDKGVFVMLDPMLPTRLLDAFPQGVTVERIGLSEAVQKTRDFFS